MKSRKAVAFSKDWAEIMAIVLCFMGIIAIFIMPRFARWWYKQQLSGNNALTTDSEYLEVERKKYTIPLKLAIWGYRIGGIIIIGIAAFIYFSDFLG